MRRLSPDLQYVARLIATGEILLIAPAMAGRTDAIEQPPEPQLALLEGSDYGINYNHCDRRARRDKEPWRRGRPLR